MLLNQFTSIRMVYCFQVSEKVLTNIFKKELGFVEMWQKP